VDRPSAAELLHSTTGTLIEGRGKRFKVLSKVPQGGPFSLSRRPWLFSPAMVSSSENAASSFLSTEQSGLRPNPKENSVAGQTANVTLK
jgi:hypothetical protein